ncbi:multicopper oxidase domain-containing protein [Streptomyces sp. XM4193]|uniref:multicopper oxidase family protein n=1 Tax=Streptomyces sp. XM4193 TaxID=2929782 RepID=UPI001FFC242D|nr:multicopper oxidase domain-containing protein [Streptomyces sp. XM4193]MCK1798059.1 multicopper oxidase domain-containing protein [Streptomyces sp. XM4193]
MTETSRLRDMLGRRGFLAGAGVVGGGLVLGTGISLTAGGGRAAALPQRPDAMTLALGTPLEKLPALERDVSREGTRAAKSAAGAAAKAAERIKPFLDPLPVPKRLRARKGELTVAMKEARVKLHRSLPATRLWTYEGGHTGPTIEARSGRRLRIAWENELRGDFPLPAIRVPFELDPDLPLMWDRPGREGAPARKDVAALPPWAVVHLHGAVTGGGNDGWAENAVLPGASQLAEYPNEQAAGGLWYHDHAMHITHLNVMAGLGAGSYLIRDEDEDRLRLPSGDREIPLVFFDRNLDLDSEGEFTGDLLYKGIVVADDPYELVRPFTGPFTLVNGVIWPHLEVEAGWYRFRALNAANNRPYLLKVLDEDGEEIPAEAFTLIGTDAGLLPRPDPVTAGVPLTPGERADLLIDFSRFRGRRLRLVNDLPEPGARPDMMEFRVGSRAEGGGFTPPKTLSRTFESIPAAKAEAGAERLVVVTPVYPKDPELWEMEEVDAPEGKLPIDGIVQFEDEKGKVRTFKRVASSFEDPVRFTVPSGSTERWRFLSLEKSPGAYPHPMHIHAVAFQGLRRDVYDVEAFEYFELDGGGYGAGTSKPLKRAEQGELTAAERGPKDVIALHPAQLITVAAEFDAPPGRFMHHCHIYEHEDMMMMRPFVVQPKEVLAIAEAMGHDHGGGHHAGAGGKQQSGAGKPDAGGHAH